MKMRFLENLEFLLKKYDMKKSDLAKKIGITQPTINAWYSKGYENVSLNTLRKISNLFHITLDELIYGDMEVIVLNVEEFSKEELNVIINLTEFIKSTRK